MDISWLPLPRVAFADLTQERFELEFAKPQKPFILSGATSAWTATTRWNSFSAFTSTVDQEIAVDLAIHGASGNLHDREECQVPLGDALTLLNSRSGTCQDKPLYLKFSYTDAPVVFDDLPLATFFTREKLQPVEHPMLLKPGTYFGWVYIGEAGSGSPSHLDVLNSSAWLVLISGRKKWRAAHGEDLHLVSKGETFCDLFAPDTQLFPDLKQARLYEGEQCPGDLVFVPSHCLHAVINREDSISVTHNFFDTTNAAQWKLSMSILLSTEKVPAKPLLIEIFQQDQLLMATIDVDCSPELLCGLNSTHLHEAAFRRILPHLFPLIRQAAFAEFPLLSQKANCVGVPFGFQRGQTLRLFYRVPQELAFEEIFGSKSRPITVAELEQVERFPTVNSFCGAIPLFPPLSVLCGHQFWFAELWRSALQPVAELLGLPQRPNRPLWHYSRFPWAEFHNKGSWCGTYLFYSSPDLTAPFNMWPLFDDATLFSEPPNAKAPVGFTPHFVQIDLDADALRVYKIQVIVIKDLMRELSLNLLLHPEWDAFSEFVGKHGLVVPEYLECGMEKVLALVLHFFPAEAGAVCGFWYDHTFTNVPEPNTFCLTAAVMNACATATAETEQSHLFRSFCLVAEDASGKAEESEAFALLAAIDASSLRSWVLAKYFGWEREDEVGEWVRQQLSPALVRYVRCRLSETVDVSDPDCPVAAQFGKLCDAVLK